VIVSDDRLAKVITGLFAYGAIQQSKVLASALVPTEVV
jgi:hypothetical protein